MRPVIVFIDDEPLNHVAFEASLPSDWEIVSVQDSNLAIDVIAKIDPWIVVCDQRMPGKSGNEILEIVKSIKPHTIRIITTGSSSEESIVNSVQMAEVQDYLVKPWGSEFPHRLKKWVQLFASQRDKRQLEVDLLLQSQELKETNQALSLAAADLRKSLEAQGNLVSELECWVHPYVLESMKTGLKFPVTKDLTVLVTDIINSSEIHGLEIEGVTVREKLLQTFWEIVLKHGGEIESQEGDKAYANFGLIDHPACHSKGAFAAAVEFRAAIVAMNEHYDLNVSCGLALHRAAGCKVFLRKSVLHTAAGIVKRKKFDTASSDVDLVHRMESVTHSLPGTNIILSSQLVEKLSNRTSSRMIRIGDQLFKGQHRTCEIWLSPDADVTEAQLEEFKTKLIDQSNHIAQFNLRKAGAA